MSARVHGSPSLHAPPLAAVDVQPPESVHVSMVQASLSSQFRAMPAMHTPSEQTSPMLQASPSSQAPAAALCWQPAAAAQTSAVHGLLSLQLIPVPAVQTALKQLSPVVHGLPSSHAPESALCVQPDVARQPSSVQGLPSSQPRFGLAAQEPALQTSPVEHTFPSEQGAPSAPVLVQPLATSQESLVQTLPSSQSKPGPP